MSTHTNPHHRLCRNMLIAAVAAAALVSKARPLAAQQAPSGAPESAASEAEPAADSAEREPVVVHHPRATVLADRQLRIDTRIEGDWKLEETVVAARPMNTDEEFVHFKLERTGSEQFSTILPADIVQPPGIEYFIASRGESGGQTNHFASADSPYRLVIRRSRKDQAIARRLARFGGARSRFEVRGDYTTYGRRNLSEVDRFGTSSEDVVTDAGSDMYWATELEYTYRVLSWLHDFRFGIGTLRGTQPTISSGGETEVLGTRSGGEVGYDYGFGEVNLRGGQYFSVGLRLILGASDAGFAAGGGAMLRLGELSGTYFEVGGELQQTIGHRGWMSFNWDTVPSVPMGLTIELSQRPTNRGPSGTRLLYDIGFEATPSITLDGRIGYASRSGGIEPGFVGGLGASYQF